MWTDITSVSQKYWRGMLGMLHWHVSVLSMPDTRVAPNGRDVLFP